LFSKVNGYPGSLKRMARDAGINGSPPDHPVSLRARHCRPVGFFYRLVLSPVVEFGRPRRFMVGDLLRHFQLAAVLQIRRDAGRAEGMIADARLDAGRFRAPADDAVGVLLEEGIGCKLTGLAAGGAEEIAVDVVGDAGPFDIIVQTLIETMMTLREAGGLPASDAVEPDVGYLALGLIRV
jgi:hypothetical protein